MFRKYGDSIRIINVDALTYAGNLENLKDVESQENYTFIRADIRDRESIEKIFEENDIDRVVSREPCGSQHPQPGDFCGNECSWHVGNAECG